MISDEKCPECVYALPVMSENGLHYNCTLPEKYSIKCKINNNMYCWKVAEAITNGIVLPSGHGRLVDKRDLFMRLEMYGIKCKENKE